MGSDPASGGPSGFECVARLGDDGFWTWRPGTPTLSANPGWYRLLGLEPRPVDDLDALQRHLHPADRPRLMALFDDLVEGRVDRVSARVRMRHRDGHDVWLRHRAYAVEHDLDGRATLIVGHDVDITAEVTAGRRALEDERRLRLLLDRVPTAVVVYGPGGRVLRWNRAAAELIGVDHHRLPEAIAERRAKGWNLIDEAGQPLPAAELPFWQALRTGQPGTPRVVGVPAPQGGHRWALMSAVPSLDPAGEVVDVVCTIADITETRRLEEGLARAHRIESLGRLAGAVAHDFNNLLTVITSTAELIAGEIQRGSPASEDLAELQRAARRGAALTRQLLDYARLRPQDPRPVDPRLLVERSASTLRRLVPADVRVTARAPRDAWSINVDPAQIERVLLNLAVNAIDAMQAGGGELVIALANQPAEAGSAEGDQVLLSVRDNGCGMTEAVATRAFDPFFTTKDIGSGTGLGLSTCHAIVTEHGGHIEIDSAVGLGTEVRIRLPRSRQPAHSSRPPGQAPVDELHGVVLVVEDEAAVRESTRRALVRHGVQVCTARNGFEALDRLEHGPPVDLVLTDVAMPGMDGPRLAEQIHRRWPDLPVLFISGTRSPDLPAPAGADVGYLPKPFGRRALVERVRAMLHRSEARPAFRQTSPAPGQMRPGGFQRRSPPSMSRQRPVK